MTTIYYGKDLFSKATIDSLKPIIHVQKEKPWFGNSRSLAGVLCESNGKYIIFWYHWPKDDYLPKEDYEPVILIVVNGRVVEVGIRPHNKYKHTREIVTENGRPIIIFATAWHRAHIYSGESSLKKHIESRSFERLSDYGVEPGKPPPYYVKARSGKSVYEFAEELALLHSCY